MPRTRYQPPKQIDPAGETLPLDTLCVVIPRQSILRAGSPHLWSDEKHPDELAAYARRLGFERVEVLGGDMGVGAYKTTIEDRQALHHWLYELLPSGESKVVLVSQEDRLFRDETEIEHNKFIAEVRKHNGWVVCMVGSRVYNFQREFDREQFRQKCKFAKQYVEIQVIGRMHPANQRAAMRGLYSGGIVPWGYVVDYRDSHSSSYKHYQRYEPHASLVVEHVFQRFAAMPRPGLLALAQAWWREGLVWPFFDASVDQRCVSARAARCRVDPTGKGYQFTRIQARHILTDVAYLGWRFRAGELAREADGAPRVCHEALVDADLFWWCFDQVLPARPLWAPARPALSLPSRRSRLRRSLKEAPGTIRFLGHGMVRCAGHGRPMHLKPVNRGQTHTTDLTCGVDDRADFSGDRACVAMRVAPIEMALCQGFLEHLALDERDMRQLAILAERRQREPQDAVAALEKELAEQQAVYASLKHVVLEATRKTPELVAEFLDEMRQAQQRVQVTTQKLAEARQTSAPSVHAWASAQRALGWADRIRTTFMEWSRSAQARVIALALQDAVLGRVNRQVAGLWMRWYGGGESCQAIVRSQLARLDWTPEEDAALRQYYGLLTGEGLQVLLPGRDLYAIRSRAYRLGLMGAQRGRRARISAPAFVVASPTIPNEMAQYGFSVGSVAEDVVVTTSGHVIPPLTTSAATM